VAWPPVRLAAAVDGSSVSVADIADGLPVSWAHARLLASQGWSHIREPPGGRTGAAEPSGKVSRNSQPDSSRAFREGIVADLARQLTGTRANRRAVVRAGLGAAGLAAGWRSEAALASQATATPELPASAWKDLAAKLTGRLLLPDDPDYPQAAWINAAAYADVKPAAVASVASAEDVAACIRWVRETGTPFAVKSGGHNYAGFSTSSGLIVDMRELGSVDPGDEGRTMTAQGGAIVAIQTNAVTTDGRYFPASRCPAVGLAGYTLGGGWSLACRKLGLGCDNLVSTEVVTAAGEMVTASETENPDLFWAMRGGAGGSFGVNTSLSYRTVESQDVTYVAATWTGGKTGEVLEALMQASSAAPREFSIRIAAVPTTRQPATDPGPVTLDVVGMHWGAPAEAEELLRPVERIQAADSHEFTAMTLPACLLKLYGGTPAGLFHDQSDFVKGTMPSQGIAAALEWIGKMPGVPSRGQDDGMVLYCFDGAVHDPKPDAMAFPHRDASFMWLSEVVWSPSDDPGLVKENIAWQAAFHEAMAPWLTGGAYANFPNRDQKDFARAYWGDNLPRLSEIKRTWDPDNLFRFPQSVPLEG